jgi:hypothetical protein
MFNEAQRLHLPDLDAFFVIQRPELYRRLSDFPDFRAVMNYPSLSILLANPVLKANCVGKERRAG